jgi:hypothetical protein
MYLQDESSFTFRSKTPTSTRIAVEHSVKISKFLMKQGQQPLNLYWVPQNSRNNSMEPCQLMLEDNEKNKKKVYTF